MAPKRVGDIDLPPSRGYEAVQRRAFKIGGSLAIRIPKRLADDLAIEDGTAVVFRREGNRLVVEVAEG